MLTLLAYGLVALLLARELSLAIYNLYLHPLKGFPGPKLWIAFPSFRYISQCRGDFDSILLKLHQQYGPCVRLSHDSLSFATSQAWNDIYGYGHGAHQWPKLEFRPPGTPQNIIFSDDVHHARFRKALGPAFSDQALRLQEALIKQYLDDLVLLLKEEAEADREVDMTMWYNLTTFDIISDLAFGESSGCLKSRAYTPYILNIFGFVRIVPFFMLARFHPMIWSIVAPVLGKFTVGRRKKLEQMGLSTMEKRKADRTKNGRGDFMEALIKHSEAKEHITDDQLAGNASMLFMAGSETSATALAGVTYLMLKTPETMGKATAEVRAAFEKEDEITFQTASTKLPYMLACLEEGLRQYPAVPTILFRTTTEDALVSGYHVPAGTHLGVHQMSSNLSPANFSRSEEFCPERWLPEATKDPSSPFHNDDREARQPFGMGPRNCIGKNLAFSEMRQILARILWNFDLELVDKKKDWTDQRVSMLWQKGPLMCRISEREH